MIILKTVIYINIAKPNQIIVKQMINNNSKWPHPRYRSTLNYYNNYLYLHGGGFHDKNYKQTHFNDIWKYSCQSNNWTKMNPNNLNIKPASVNHVSLIYNEYIIFFGGYGTNNTYYNDVYAYNIKLNEIKIYKNIQNKPKKRYWHAATLFNNMLMIHGGITNEYPNNLNDCQIIDIKKVLTNKNVSWNKYNIDIDYLYGHKIISHQNRIIIFGGENKKRQSHNNLVIFDNNKQKSLINIAEISQRYGHSMCNINNKYIFIFGGMESSGNYKNDMYLIELKFKEKNQVINDDKDHKENDDIMFENTPKKKK